MTIVNLLSYNFVTNMAMGTMIFTVGGATVEFMKVAIGGILAGFVYIITPIFIKEGC